jgi:hypothetical protein
VKKYEINFLPEKSQKNKTGTVEISISRAIDIYQKIYMLGRDWKFAVTGTL